MTAITQQKELVATYQAPASEVAIVSPKVPEGKNYGEWRLEKITVIKVSNLVGKMKKKYNMVFFQGLRWFPMKVSI